MRRIAPAGARAGGARVRKDPCAENGERFPRQNMRAHGAVRRRRGATPLRHGAATPPRHGAATLPRTHRLAPDSGGEE
jgi:hypothetical protein